MNAMNGPPLAVTHEVRDACLCLHVQRAARTLARHFDEAFGPLGLSHGQFSLMMSANTPTPRPMGEIAALLAMDRTTLTANVKPLQRRGLVTVSNDHKDKRARLVELTDAGRALLIEAVPIWRREHANIEAGLPKGRPDPLRSDLLAISHGPRRRG